MCKRLFTLTVAALVVLLMAIPAVADWVPNHDTTNHKMHFPQFPDVLGWDVAATGNAAPPMVLADDWMCSETGWVKDVHFWGSWMHGDEGQVISFVLSIHEDIPADPPMIPYSRPGITLWEREITNFITAAPVDPPGPEGWYNPAEGQYFFEDHLNYYQYNVFLDEIDWFWQEQGTIYWLNISAIVADPLNTQWGWKSTLDHWNDDAVWGLWGELNWIDIWEPPDFSVSLDLAFVITGGDEKGACCFTDPPQMLCVETTEDDCVNNLMGVYQGDGTVCGGMQACCLPDGSCINADALCCVNELGGTPQGAGSFCSGQTIACCFMDGSCLDVDPLCCDDLGGTPSPTGAPACLGDGNHNGTDDACEILEGACCVSDPPQMYCFITTQQECENDLLGVYQGDGTICGGMQACCLPDGSCITADALCCVNVLGGTPQGAGTACSGQTIACCLPDGSCMDLDPLCCDDLGGVPSPIGATACLGDGNGNGTDDACEEPPQLKWEQLPDLSPTGMDVYANYPILVLADDFPCTERGSIVEIHVWASWYHDILPSNPGNVMFTLSFHSDVPAGPTYSYPGDTLWMGHFGPGEFEYNLHAEFLEEGWYDPVSEYYDPWGDSQCWEYIFTLDIGEFIQRGTVEEPVVYWLDVQALPMQEAYFGWKTSLFHWNDDAVWVEGIDPPIDMWNELRYPEGHPFFSESIDLAFAIYGIPSSTCCIQRGNIDHSVPQMPLNSADLLWLVDYMFQGGPVPPCPEEGDTDNSGSWPPNPGMGEPPGPLGDVYNSADLLWLVDYMFSGGAGFDPCR